MVDATQADGALLSASGRLRPGGRWGHDPPVYLSVEPPIRRAPRPTWVMVQRVTPVQLTNVSHTDRTDTLGGQAPARNAKKDSFTTHSTNWAGKY